MTTTTAERVPAPFAAHVAGTEPPVIYDPWAPSLEGTVPAPKGWEELPGGWKTHYRVARPRRVSKGLVEALRAEIGEERWDQLQREWADPHFEPAS